MIKDRIIFVFGVAWVDTHVHYSINEKLIKYNKLVWIGSLGLRKPKFSILDIKRILEKLKNMFVKKQVTKTDENITIVHPFILPFHNIWLVRYFNKNNIVKAINAAVKKYT
jgi:hypothetical protein